MILNEKIIITILDKYEIKYYLEGKNVSNECIGITCPFCNDKSVHGGIFKDNGQYTCWRCEARYSLYKLLKHLVDITYDDYLTDIYKIKQIHQQITSISNKKQEKVEQSDIQLPLFFRYVKDKCPMIVKQFFRERQISIKTCEKYHVGFCKYGEYAQRLIIPIYFENKLVGWQGRDVTRKSKVKYKTSKTAINNYLYNYDSPINNELILVEGMFDVWRLENNALCSFGTHLTTSQRRLIVNKRPKQLIFAWDGDAYGKAKQQAKQLLPFINNIKIVSLPKGEDPDSLGKNRVFELIKKTSLLK